ncbi:MAG: hypothetical protein LH481_03440, partial [Burkholderiales bacterium]|nr:hypothetical protein [Burkholderiales bacterium]
MISLAEYKKHFLGFNVLGCAVRSRDMFGFVVQEDYTQSSGCKGRDPPEESDLKKRMIPFIRSKLVGNQW